MRSRTAPSCAPARPGTVAGESAAGVLLGIFLARRADDPLGRLLTPNPDGDDVYSPAARALERVAREVRSNPLLVGVTVERANQLALKTLHERALAALEGQTVDNPPPRRPIPHRLG